MEIFKKEDSDLVMKVKELEGTPNGTTIPFLPYSYKYLMSNLFCISIANCWHTSNEEYIRINGISWQKEKRKSSGE